MRLIGSDPDVQTIVSRIRSGDILLQPDFQRGEVWGEQKKRRLIDSILRQWHVPPIHVIEVKETARHEVLDGQQRLVAIRDFACNHLTVDGTTEPSDPEISALDGLTYEKLPNFWKRRFNQFTIRLFIITDYLPGEPGELFFRLNQPTNLTAAEQRNAFFGPARQQVKDLVSLFEHLGLSRETIGFSNSRMAYDDVIAKLCLTVDNGTLMDKVTAAGVTFRYRSQEPFRAETIDRVTDSIKLFAQARRLIRSSPIKFNKATLFSWLCFNVRALGRSSVSAKALGECMLEFEKGRNDPLRNVIEGYWDYLFDIFNDRASSRVSDVSSVIIRDAIIWLFFWTRTNGVPGQGFRELRALHRNVSNSKTRAEVDHLLDRFVTQTNWGNDL